MQELKIALPENLRARLNEVSKKSGKSLAEEIRSRVEQAFAEDDLDPSTRELRDFLPRIATRMRAEYSTEWHLAPRGHEAFAAAVADQINVFKPEVSEGASALLYYGPDDPPDAIGRMHARDERRTGNYPLARAAEEKHRKRLTIKRKKGEGQ